MPYLGIWSGVLKRVPQQSEAADTAAAQWRPNVLRRRASVFGILFAPRGLVLGWGQNKVLSARCVNPEEVMRGEGFSHHTWMAAVRITLDTFRLRWCNVGQASTTPSQHYTNVDSSFSGCSVIYQCQKRTVEKNGVAWIREHVWWSSSFVHTSTLKVELVWFLWTKLSWYLTNQLTGSNYIYHSNDGQGSGILRSQRPAPPTGIIYTHGYFTFGQFCESTIKRAWKILK